MSEKRKELPRSKLEYARDTCLLAGFLMVGCGLWMIRPWVALVVCGAMLLWVGFPPRAPKIPTPQQQRGRE